VGQAQAQAGAVQPVEAQAGAVQPDAAQAGAVGQEQAQATPEIAKAFAAEQPAGKGKKAKGKKAQAGTTRQEQAQAGTAKPEQAQGGTVRQEQAQGAKGKGRKVAPKVAPAEPTYVVGYQYTPKQIAKLSFAKMREAAKKNKYKDGSSVWDRVPGKNKLKDDVRAELLRHRKMYMEAEGKKEREEWSPERRKKASIAASARMYQRPDKYYDAMEEDLDALVKGEAEKGNLLEAGVRVMRTDSGEADDTVWTVLDMVFPSEIELSRGELRYSIESEGGRIETVWRRDIEPVEVEDGNSGGAGEGVFEGEPFVDEGAGGDVGPGSVEAGAAQGTGRAPEKPSVAPGGQVQLFGQDEGGFALVGGEVIDGERVNRERAEREAAAAARAAAQGKLFEKSPEYAGQRIREDVQGLLDVQDVPTNHKAEATTQGDRLAAALIPAAARVSGQSTLRQGSGTRGAVDSAQPELIPGAGSAAYQAFYRGEWQKAFDEGRGIVSRVIASMVRRDVKHVDLRGYLVKTSDDAAALFAAMHAPQLVESFKVLYLDSRGAVIDGRVLGLGVLDACMVEPREVYGNMPEGTASVVLGHNHPSGKSDPSAADIHITRKLIAAAQYVGVYVMDHVIINGKRTSLREAGLASFVYEGASLPRRSVVPSSEHRTAPAYKDKRSWEVMPHTEAPSVRSEADAGRIVENMIRSGAKDTVYVLGLNTQSALTTVFQFDKDVKPQDVIRTVARETGRSGLKAAVMYHPGIAQNADTTAFSRMILKGLQINGIQLLDVVTMTEVGPNYWYSYRINGVIDFSGDVEETGPNWMMAKEPQAEYKMHGTAERVAGAPLGDSVLGRPGS
jgi:hypothetical protein